MGKLDGKVIIVTGASRGIGTAIAKLFAAEGGKVAVVARTLHEGEHQLEGSLERTVQEIQAAGGEAFPIAANLTEAAECQRIVDEARAHFGPIDVVVNNAAVTWYIPLKQYPLGRWEKNFAVNVTAPLLLAQASLPDMIAKHDGAIVNISSGSAIGPSTPPYATKFTYEHTLASGAYGATKAALNRWTAAMAWELYDEGVRVNALSPSQLVVTPGAMYHGTKSDGLHDEPADYMAQAALLLATEPIDKVTGRITYSQRLLHEFGILPEAKGPEEMTFPRRAGGGE